MEEVEAIPVEAEITALVSEPDLVEVEPIGLSESYYLAVELITGYSGVELTGSATLREHLANVKNSVADSVYNVFERLSLLYEKWLYGPPEVPQDEAAKSLYKQIKEFLTFED